MNQAGLNVGDILINMKVEKSNLQISAEIYEFCNYSSRQKMVLLTNEQIYQFLKISMQVALACVKMEGYAEMARVYAPKAMVATTVMGSELLKVKHQILGSKCQ